MSAHALFNLNERIHRGSSRLIACSAIAGMAGLLHECRERVTIMEHARVDHEALHTAEPARERAGTTSLIEVTWASTSTDPAKRLRIGKIWKPKVKWPVTPGAKRKAYVFERARYPDLEAFSVDLDARMRDGGFALVAGWLKPNLDPLQTHPRRALNFVDGPSWLLSLDFDGLAAANSMRLDRPEDFGAGALREARERLPAAFDADCVLYATSSTGLPVNAKGEPANGCARFRVVFWLSRPLSFAEQRQITQALKALPGLDCLDDAVCTVTQFSFVARPVFSDGMADPIEKPVLVFKGAQRRLDVNLLLSVIDAELPLKRGPGQRSPVSAEERRLDVDPELRVLARAPGRRRHRQQSRSKRLG